MNENGTNMSNLQHLIEPDPIRYSFDTPGWHLVLILLIIILLVTAFIQYRKYRKNAYRREALQKLEAIKAGENSNMVYDINLLLKTISICLFGRQNVANLYGTEWFLFLTTKIKNTPVISQGSIEAFNLALYNNNYELDELQRDELLAFSELWIKKHKVDG